MIKKIIVCLFIIVNICITSGAQHLQNYKGEFNFPCGRLFMRQVKAKYQYYEDEVSNRIYHGNFELTFEGDGSTDQIKRGGHLTGQFIDGYFEGDWSFFYRIKVSGISNPSNLFTAILKCHFDNGLLNGPLEVYFTDISKNIVSKIVIPYENGMINGDLSFYSYLDFRTNKIQTQISGKCDNGKRVGRWDYIIDGKRGIIDYDEDGHEISNFIIDNESGDKRPGIDIGFGNMGYGGVDLNDLMGAFTSLSNISRDRFNKSRIKAEENKTKEIKTSAKSSSEPDNDYKVFDIVDQMPSFPGGEAALKKYLNENLTYPISAESSIQGTVLLQVVIQKDGSIGEVKVVWSLEPDFDREAVRVAKGMPNFIPGRMNGQPVNVWYSLPVRFKILT